MAYPYFQGYPSYNPMYYQQLQNMQQPQQNTQQTTQIQNGGFVMVKDISEALNYPVAPGNSVTFKNENQPYIYTKTLGFSQLDQPVFETFKLVKEERAEASKTALEEPMVQFLTLDEGNALRAELDALKAELIELNTELTELKHELGDDMKMEVSA